MKNIFLLLSLTVSAVYAQNQNSLPNPSHNTIQLALLLDVSSSMDGLISQAKTELWTIVNEVAKAHKNGHHTRLEIALYEYGRSTSPAENGYIIKLLDYTSDLDTVSEILFGLNTNGGNEYCGMVMDKALHQLQWLDNDSVYRVIFIAGNEPFNQGSTDFRTTAYQSALQGITINTIHCGDSMEGVRGYWREGALLGKGDYFFIQQNSKEYDIPTPYDSMIGVYNDSLNTTYWHFGKLGMVSKMNQVAQDNNAGSFSTSVKAKRAVSKTKSVYDNKKWDAVDASKNDTAFIRKTAESDLPKELKGKTEAEKKAALDSVSQSRAAFSKKINDLNTLRETYIREHKPKEEAAKKSLGQALVEAIHKQAGIKGFIFE